MSNRRTNLQAIAAFVVCGAFCSSACKQPAEAAPANEKKEPGVDVSLSPRALAGAKLATGKPQRVPRRSSLTVAGSVDFVPSHVARIGPQISGRVASVPVTSGQTVSRGAVVVTLDSVDIGRARADFLQAKSQLLLAESELARENRLIEAGASSERAQQTARTSLDLAKVGLSAASDRLHTLGASPGQGASGFSLVSPIEGKVLEVKARLGQPVGPTDTLIVVGETTEVWLAVDIYERDLAHVHQGDDVLASAVAYPERTFEGKVDQLASVVDSERRVLEARIVLQNPDGALRPGMTATARILSVPEAGAPSVISVPRGALQTIDGQPFVFVELGAGKFELRAVDRGVELEQGVEIKQGLTGEESIVTEGSFVLKSEVLRSQMGSND
ncbi:MAG TPA: efflux RND transporter periplasmic adaptor subunit [Polyangiaceae bacterium]|nr:efflux RND transporter periplasmic adaptor subunit [Polyangiaceae bacterium]